MDHQQNIYTYVPKTHYLSAAEADVILIGVKPAMVPDLLREIAPSLRPGAIVVSLAAGVTTATYEALLPEGVLRELHSDAPPAAAWDGRAVQAPARRRGPVANRAIETFPS